MEASSPLAAMQPPSFGSMWARNDLFNSHGHMNGGTGMFGPGSFNFRDISMNNPRPKPNRDYFSTKPPVRGSSPTASLAADLSQNFHIDMSPQLPTPRRSLFTSSMFGSFETRVTVTTPPLPSSSPGPLNERMDISPLPHKLPFSAQIEVHSPTPVPTPNEEALPSSPPSTSCDAPKIAERRKSCLLRPGLTRAKGYSTNSVPVRPSFESNPPFRFGAGSSKLSTSVSMSLDECFVASPKEERRPQSANSPCAFMMGSKPKQPFGSMCTSTTRNNGSPINGHYRRPSNPLVRPRKLYRRSLSMFESPGDVMSMKKDDAVFEQPNLPSVMDVDEPAQPMLPHFFLEGTDDSIPRINRNTFLDILDGKFDSQYDQRLVIDCRFEYEFEGGHIEGAVNYNDRDLISTHLFENSMPGNTLLIFHCEYSAHRAPRMAGYVRSQDRAANVEHYPKLTYPEVYILDGGYSAFFSENRNRCFPQNYVEMDAQGHAFTREREMGRLRQNRAKLGRAQTFAFGDRGYMDDSPTAPSRPHRASDTSMISGSPLPHQTRRMASY